MGWEVFTKHKPPNGMIIMKEKDTIIVTFTEMAPRYEDTVDAELKRFWGWSYKGFVNKLIDMTPIGEGDKVLDIATGTGVIPHKLMKERLITERVNGLDITMPMLTRAKRRFEESGIQGNVDLVCASAMDMPYANETFSLVICGLATHHMVVNKLLAETNRILMEGGILSIADVGGSKFWKFPGVKLFLRIAGFIYFLAVENVHRAWAESNAVSNVRSKEDWTAILVDNGFGDISITKLISKYFWIPEPLVIRAKKKEKKDDELV